VSNKVLDFEIKRNKILNTIQKLQHLNAVLERAINPYVETKFDMHALNTLELFLSI
jgi:hypothetical protein